jgi:ribosomal protein S18 acetylase RimI-like enzyme
MTQNATLRLREPSFSEFLEVAKFSFDQYVNETAKSSGEYVEAVRAKVGGPPTERSANHLWFLVELAGVRIGFVWFEMIPQKNSAFGWDIYLEPRYRAKGVGKWVMQSCAQELIERGVGSAKICVFEHNEIARKLYTSLGFIVESFDEARKQYTLILNLK